MPCRRRQRLHSYMPFLRCPFSQTNLKQGEYDGKTASFTQDLAQIWGNCQTFNEHTSLLYLISQRLDSLSRTMTQRYLVDTPFVPKVEMAPPAAPLGSSAAAKPGASSTAPLPVAPDVAAVVAKFAPNFVMPLRHFTTSHSAKERMQFIVDHVAGLDAAQDFVQPVDLAMFSDYLQHVTTPMDLSTVKVCVSTSNRPLCPVSSSVLGGTFLIPHVLGFIASCAIHRKNSKPARMRTLDKGFWMICS